MIPIFVLLLGGVLHAQDAVIDGTAMVLHVSGNLTLREGAGHGHPLAAGAPLARGSTVCTEPDSYATIRLARDLQTAGHDDVSLFPKTCLTFEEIQSGPSLHAARVSMEEGSIAVRAVDAVGSLAVRTRDGVTAGTEGGFRVTVEQGSTRTEAVERPVSVTGAGQEMAVRAGQGTRVREGQAPQTPVDLPPSARLERPEDGGVILRPDFSWLPVAGALGYRVEIASSEDFASIVTAEEVPGATWRPEVLFLPYRVSGLYWRVSTFDRVGFLGAPSAPRALAFPAGVGP